MAAEIFRLLGKIGLDGVEEAYKQIDGVNNKAGLLGTAFDKAGKVVAGVGKAVAVGMGAAATAIGGIVKSSVDAYAEYEQLVGGSQLMFGEAYDFIADKAANAYSAVQMSQSEYLQQVNGFAVGLKTAMGGDAQAAAELADKIITAEADIVAATGNATEAVQNAFNGIMKGNFTMLDNLGLGINATKEGFQEVINRVNAWNKAQGKATNYTIDNVADCQAALVDYVEMQGMAGYAAEEAAETIQGSTAMMKASWSNLVTGFADENADLEELVNNFVDSTVLVIGNIGNRVQEILPRLVEGLGTLLENLSPHLTSLMETLLPGLIEGAVTLLTGLIEELPMLLEILTEQAPFILSEIGSALLEAIPILFESAKELVYQVMGYIGEEILGLEPDFDFAFIEDLFNSAWESCQYIWDEIGKPIFDAMSEIFGKAKEALQPFIDKITEYVTEGELANDITEAVKTAVDFLVDAYEEVVGFIESVVTGFQDAVEWGQEHATMLEIIASAVGILTSAIGAYNIAQGIKRAGGILELAQLAATAIGVGALTVAETAHTAVTTIATAATTAFGAAMAFLTSPITLVVAAIGAVIAIVVLLVKHWDEVKEAAAIAWEWIKETWNKVATWFNEKVIQPIVEFFTGLWNDITGIFSVVGEWFSKKFLEAKEAIETAWSTVTEFFSGIWDSVCEVFKNAVEIGQGIIDDIKEGISNAWEGLKEWFSGLWDGLFGNRRVDVEVNGTSSGVHGSHADGLDYVPFDGYVAELHKGEMVVPAVEANVLRNGNFVNSDIENILLAILEAVQDGNSRETVMKFNNREFARMVKAVN